MIKRLLFTCLLCAISFTVMAQTDLQKEKGAIVGIKTNALYWGTATPNLGLEFRLARHWSLDLEAGLNPFILFVISRYKRITFKFIKQI